MMNPESLFYETNAATPIGNGEYEPPGLGPWFRTH